MSFTKFIGRILIATILVSSAYQHLTTPQKHTGLFIKNYNSFTNVAKSFAQLSLPSSDSLNWLLFVKVFGLFQGLIALLIFFGDSTGGIFWTLSLIIQGIFLYHGQTCPSKFLQWTVAEKVAFSKHVMFVGIALLLICGNCHKNKCNTQRCQDSKCSK